MTRRGHEKCLMAGVWMGDIRMETLGDDKCYLLPPCCVLPESKCPSL